MRILLLTPGTGSFLCGSCLRDNALAVALRAAGADALITPLYLPFALEDEPAEEAPVRLGGINVWLAERLPLLTRLPRRWLDHLDRPGLLRFVAGRANMTGAAGLGEMTLSMLAGEAGRQKAEVAKLVEWARGLERPDVVVLSNAMLAGLVRELRRALDCPVVCTLQGEAPFLDALGQRYRDRAWRILTERVAELDAFVAVSRYTAELMTARLALPPERVSVVWNGIDPSELDPGAARPGDAPDSPGPPTVGYLARMCEDKGLGTLWDAFELVKERVPDARLTAAGVVLGDDEKLVARCRARARSLGFAADVSFTPDVSRAEKIELLQRATVVSVPATYGESFGLYLLEAWAAGAPVVQPRHGAFPELVEATGGGLLCEPDDPRSLADALVLLLQDRARARALGAAGKAGVHARFTATRMARDVLEVCRRVARPA